MIALTEKEKAKMFDYLCQLEKVRLQKEWTSEEDRKDTDYLVFSLEDKTFWGKSYAEAVAKAMEEDKF